MRLLQNAIDLATASPTPPTQSMSESTRALPNNITALAPSTGTAFLLRAHQHLRIIDPQGKQVADLLAYNAADKRETLSNGRTFDYADKLLLTAGDALYSNRSNVLLRIVRDTVGRHDFLFTPCSTDTFRVKFGGMGEEGKAGCFGNLVYALGKRFEILDHEVGTPFNCFMNVVVDGGTGGIEVREPLSGAGDFVEFVAEVDLIVGLTACSARRSNAGVCKEIWYSVW